MKGFLLEQKLVNLLQPLEKNEKLKNQRNNTQSKQNAQKYYVKNYG